jgi:hypothetical protein
VDLAGARVASAAADLGVAVGRERGVTMTDPAPTDPNAAEELDEAVEAVEQHQQAEQDADADEHVVVRDPDTGHLSEEPAQ